MRRRGRAWWIVAALLALSLALTACGGSSSDKAQVESVARRYFASLGSGNGAELCSLLSGEATQQLIRGGALIGSLTHRSKPLSCPEVVTAVHETLGGDQLAELRKVNVSVHSLSGNNASVRVTVPKAGRTVLVPMTKTADGWLISGVQFQTVPR
jgi:hypothetical protein